MKQSILIYLRGILMGAADILPGISGGTIALITGIYETLISSLGNINYKALTKLHTKTFWNSINFKFFVPLALGIVTAILTLTKLLTYLLNTHVAPTYAFFFGLILASTLVLYKKITDHSVRGLLYTALGFALAYALAANLQVAPINNPFFLFISAALAICALLLPGVSGSLLLVLLNQYDKIISAINNLEFTTLTIFAAGAITGLISFSKLIHYLLKKYHNQTLLFLTGLMLGSLRAPLAKMATGSSTYLGLFVVAGIIIVFATEQMFKK